MAASHLFRLGKVTGNNGIEALLKHHRRECLKEGEHIDSTRSMLNYSLYGESSPRDIALRAKVAMLQAGIEKPRKNGVMGVEIFFSLPIDRHQQDTRPFFEDCLSWVQRNMQGELLSFDVHLDESAPHAHAVILPLVEGRMQGSDMVGGIDNLKRLTGMWFKDVGRLYGLSLGSGKLKTQEKDRLAREVIKALAGDEVQRSILWPFLRNAIHADPSSYAQHLGLNHKPAKYQGRSFVQIMTSPGHGKAQNPIGN